MFKDLDEKDEFTKKLNDTKLVVKATNFEVFSFWQETQDKSKWVQEPGYSIKLGELAGLPVTMSLAWEIVDGKRVLFWDLISQVSDQEMAINYFKANLPKVERTDAWNFWARLNSIK